MNLDNLSANGARQSKASHRRSPSQRWSRHSNELVTSEIYPGTARSADASPVLGWAGWDHAEQAIALARLLTTQEALGADHVAVEPLLAGLVELEPWLHQWHAQIDPAFGTSPASTVSGLLGQKLAEYGLTRDEVTRRARPVATRGRKAKVSSSTAAPSTALLDEGE